jgi:sulfite reductase alpha subunit-like flavoprotein
VFLEWSEKLWKVLDEIFPQSLALPPIPEDELLPPRYKVVLTSDSPVPGHSNPLGSFPCRVKQNTRITAPGHWQDVRHIILESQNPTLAYEPGDIVELYPLNPSDEVDAFLDILHWSNIADSPLSLTHILTGGPVPTRTSPTTLRSLATEYLDICSVPRRSFFELVKHFSTDPLHVEKFEEFCTAEGQEELWDYTSRPRRTIVEVLADFWSSLEIPFEYVLDVFPAMKPRRFSIASCIQVRSCSGGRFTLGTSGGDSFMCCDCKV